MADPLLRIKREQLATFCPDHDTIKQFERLFSLVNQTQSSSAEDALFVAETALARINSLQVPTIADVSESALLVAETALANSNNAIAISEANDFWKRTGTTLETKFANDDLQIDSFVRVNGSSDTQQLIVKGHSTQTANLQEWQNGSAVLQANMTNSGAFRNYVSYTDASNYEAGIFDWQENSGDLTIGALRTGEYAGRNVIVQATDSTGDGVYYGRVGGALTLKAGKPWDQASVYPNSYGGQIKIDTFTYNGVAPNYGDITIESAYNDRNAGRKSRVNIKSYNTTLIERGALGARPTTATTTIKQFSGQISNLLNFVNSSWTDSSAQNNILSSFDYLGNYLNYNTYTDASNYERAVFTWDTNILKIKTEALGTGTVRPIEIQGAGTTVLPESSTDVPLTVKGASGQTANLFELDDSSGKKRMSVSSNGNLITLGRTDYAAWQGINDTCTITTGVGGGRSTTACDLVIRPASDSLLADTYIYAGHKLSNGGGAGNLTIGQEDFSGNASPTGMGTVLIRTGSMASQSGGSFDGGTLAITTGGGGGFGAIGTPAGAGGAFNVTLGDGKASHYASVVAGAGGSFTLTAGNGGVASGATSTGGDGGSIVLTAGSKGTGTGTDGVDGIIDLASTTKIKALRETVASVSTSTTLTHTITYVRQTSSSITTTLWASPVNGDTIEIRNRGGGSNTIDGNGINIEGASTYTINDGDSICLVYDGIEWTI